MRSIYLLVPLMACTVPATPTARYIGSLAPRKPSAACTATRASLVLTNGAVRFTPGEGTWVLEGTADPSGAVTAERTVTGADKKPYVTRLTGQWTPTGATGTYVTPRCAYTLDASRS